MQLQLLRGRLLHTPYLTELEELCVAEPSEVIAGAGVFSPKAEVTNGRAAMLGIAILLVLEQNAGASFF